MFSVRPYCPLGSCTFKYYGKDATLFYFIFKRIVEHVFGNLAEDMYWSKVLHCGRNLTVIYCWTPWLFLTCAHICYFSFLLWWHSGFTLWFRTLFVLDYAFIILLKELIVLFTVIKWHIKDTWLHYHIHVASRIEWYLNQISINCVPIVYIFLAVIWNAHF